MELHKIWRVKKHDWNLLFHFNKELLFRLRFEAEFYKDSYGGQSFSFNITLFGLEFDFQVYRHHDEEVVPL
jgi:hypothetical protein